MSEQLLFADGCDEFLEVERFEVGYVLEVAGAKGLEGRGEHRGCFRVALAEISVRMLYDVGAFTGAVSYEEDRALLQIFCEAVFVDYYRCGFCDLFHAGTAFSGSCTLPHCGIYLHPAGIDHRD